MVGEQAGLWFITETEEATTEVLQGTRGSEDTGGGFGSGVVQQVRKSLTQRVQIGADELKQEVRNLVTVVADVFDQANAGAGLLLEDVELSIQISSQGQISILGSGGRLEGKGGIKLTFKRKPPPV
jgi:hypothetical protein